MIPHQQYIRECSQYWDMVESFTVEEAAALWCGGDPSRPDNIGDPCYSVKLRILRDAVRLGKLPYNDLNMKPFPMPVEELLNKRLLTVDRSFLRQWFEQLPGKERPAFLYDESRQNSMPDVSDREEMNILKALAIMAHIIANRSPYFRKSDGQPNAKNISDAVMAEAEAVRIETHGLGTALRNRITKAVKTFEGEIRLKP